MPAHPQKSTGHNRFRTDSPRFSVAGDCARTGILGVAHWAHLGDWLPHPPSSPHVDNDAY